MSQRESLELGRKIAELLRGQPGSSAYAAIKIATALIDEDWTNGKVKMSASDSRLCPSTHQESQLASD